MNEKQEKIVRKHAEGITKLITASWDPELEGYEDKVSQVENITYLTTILMIKDLLSS